MTRRDLIQKWLIYGSALLPIWLLDGCILPYFPVFGFLPMLLPLAAVAVAVLEGTCAGAGYGMVVGLVWELAYPGGFGGLVMAMLLVGLVTGILSQYALSQSLPGYLLCSAGTLALLEVLRILRGLITHTAALSVLLQTALPEALLTMIWSPLIWLLYSRIYDKVGGEKLA